MSFAWLRLRATVQRHTIVESWRGLRPVPVYWKLLLFGKTRGAILSKIYRKILHQIWLTIKNNNNKHWALFPLGYLINRQDQQIMLNYCISFLWQRMCQPSQRHLTAIEKKCGEKHLVFYSGYIAPTFSSISTREVFIVQGVPLSKHITHYGPWTSFPYFNHTTPTSNKI